MNAISKHGTVNYLKKLYHSSPLIVIMLFSFAYAVYSKLRSFWLPVHLYKGITNEGGQSLKFCYLGWNKGILSYWLRRIFEHYEQIPLRKYVPVWKIRRFVKEQTQNCDLALVELANLKATKHTSEVDGIVLPQWVKMHLDVETSLSTKSVKCDIMRRIRKHALEIEKANTVEDFRHFYKQMYKPYIELRHKESAVVEDYKKMLQGYKKEKSAIYFIVKDGVRVAAMYEQVFNGIPYLHGLGILDGSDEIRKMGVIGALYYFALIFYKEKGIKRVDIGGTSPLIRDGLTRFKLSLAARISGIQHQDSARLKLLPLGNTPAAKDFLRANPLIYIKDETMCLAVFENEANDDLEYQKLLEKSKAMQASETRIFSFKKKNSMIGFKRKIFKILKFTQFQNQHIAM